MSDTNTPDIYGKPYKHGLDPAVVTAFEAIGFDVTEYSPDGEPEFMTEAEGPLGMVAAIARCPKKKLTVNASGFILDEEDFDGAKTITLGGRFFILGKDGKKFTGKEFGKINVTATSWPLITGPAGA